MATNLRELDPDSPEFEAAVEAAQAAEDEANGNTEVLEEDETPEGEAPAAVAEKSTEPAAEAAPDPEQKPADGPIAGVLSADGKRVLPYVALKAERRAASHERKLRATAERERDEALRRIEQLKSGAVEDEPSSDELSDEELEDLRLVGAAGEKVVARLRAAQEQLAKLTPEKPADAEPVDEQQAARDAVQEDIDSIPLLLEWQASDAEKFGRAIELDNVLKNSRKWADKPRDERFAHITALVADEFDVEFVAAPRTTTTPSRANPKKVIEQAVRTAPSTLSDFKGGAADQTEVPLDRLPRAQLHARFAEMTDDELDRHLAKFG